MKKLIISLCLIVPLLVIAGVGINGGGGGGSINGGSGGSGGGGGTTTTNLQGTNGIIITIVGSTNIVGISSSVVVNGATNALGMTNGVLTGWTTNLDTSVYPPPLNNTLNIRPTPNVFFVSDFAGNGSQPSEAHYTNEVLEIATNGYEAHGINLLQLDAGWSIDRTNGFIRFNTNNWQHEGKYQADFAHSSGVKLGLYMNPQGTALYGQLPDFTNNVLDTLDIWYPATNWGVDQMKADLIGQWWMMQQFWSVVGLTGEPIYRQMTGGTTAFVTYPSAPYSFSPVIPQYVNSYYPTLNLPDTSSPQNFTNILTHFLTILPILSQERPGFYLEGVGSSGQINNTAFGYAYPNHIYYDLATMAAENVQGAVDNLTRPIAAFLNDEWLGMLRDPAVIPVQTVITNYTVGGATNYTLIRPLGRLTDYSSAALCFVNTYTVTNTFTLSITNFMMGSNTCATLYSPWYHSLENWVTNSLTISIPPTNTLMYRVVSDFHAPNFVAGTNYLSDQNWQMGAWPFDGQTPFLGNPGFLNKDFRFTGSANAALVIGATTYTKGFSMGVGESGFSDTLGPWGNYTATNSYFTMALGGVCKIVLGAWGKQQNYNGGTVGGRLTIYGDGVQLWQSGFVTNNTTDATNFSISVAGVNQIEFYMDHDGVGNVQGVIGNCIVTLPQTYVGTFVGDGSQLTNMPYAQTFSGTNLSETYTQNPNGSTNVTLSLTNIGLGTYINGSSNATAVSMLGLDSANHLVTNAVPSSGSVTYPFYATIATNLVAGSGITNAIEYDSTNIPFAGATNFQVGSLSTSISNDLQTASGAVNWMNESTNGNVTFPNNVTNTGVVRNNGQTILNNTLTPYGSFHDGNDNPGAANAVYTANANGSGTTVWQTSIPRFDVNTNNAPLTVISYNTLLITNGAGRGIVVVDLAFDDLTGGNPSCTVIETNLISTNNFGVISPNLSGLTLVGTDSVTNIYTFFMQTNSIIKITDTSSGGAAVRMITNSLSKW